MSTDLADELHDRKERGDSYEDVIWDLIDAADSAADQDTDREPDVDPTADAGAPDDADGQDSDRQHVERHVDPDGFPTDERPTLDALTAAYAFLRDREKATMRHFVQNVMPDHSLGYDVPDLEEGDRYRGAWWRSVVRPGLEQLPDVRAPEGNDRWWRFDPDGPDRGETTELDVDFGSPSR